MICSEWRQRSAYMLLKGDCAALEGVWKAAQTWPNAIGAWMVTGPWDVILWLDAYSWEDIYDKAVAVRSKRGVELTSTHFVYRGMKNGRWWWQWPAGTWVFMRSPHLNGDMKSLGRWPWVASAASVPGDWDYMAWAGGKDWEQVWQNVWTLNKAGWQTETLVPIRSWWNKSWQKNWWA